MDVPKPSSGTFTSGASGTSATSSGTASGTRGRRPDPFGIYGALVGWSASRPLPAAIRPSAYRAFARAVGADITEAELDLREYPTLGDFFVRRLKAGARSIEPAADAIVSPCDGVVAALGTADGGTLIQAKGRDYQLAELLADDTLAARLTGGVYCTIYLSPRDYHRVHAPVSGRVASYDYLPGSLWPVNPRVAARRDRLLSRNERVVIRLEAGALGTVAVVMVGASGVGHIDLAHLDGADPSTRAWRRAKERVHRAVDAPVERGHELGAFRLGSTVVLVFEPGAVRAPDAHDAPDGPDVGEGSAVRFGQRLFTSLRGAGRGA